MADDVQAPADPRSTAEIARDVLWDCMPDHFLDSDHDRALLGGWMEEYVIPALAAAGRLRQEPRVWLDGDQVPAETWVLVTEEEDPEERVYQLDAYEPCVNGNFGPLIEILLPAADDAERLVQAAQARRAEVSR